MDKYTSIGVKLKDLRGRMCTHISAVQCHLLTDLFLFSMLMTLHVLHIMVKFQINILIRTQVINVFVFLP